MMDGTRICVLKLSEREVRLLINCLYNQAIKSRADAELSFLVKTEGKLFDALAKQGRQSEVCG